MFITYGFLHSGPSHLVVNMITLLSLGRGVVARVGSWGFVLLYLATLLGGGCRLCLARTGAAADGGSVGRIVRVDRWTVGLDLC
ncbi:rhomboid family intramembrane serine protease [Yoonia sp.]|nr:rhomboid family intramembrane serine protease [Yoonia sp.]